MLKTSQTLHRLLRQDRIVSPILSSKHRMVQIMDKFRIIGCNDKVTTAGSRNQNTVIRTPGKNFYTSDSSRRKISEITKQPTDTR